MLWTDHNYPSEPQHCLGHAEFWIFVRAIKILALSGNSTDIPRAEGAATHRSGSDRHRHQSARRDRFSVLRAPVKPKSLAGPSVGRRTRSVHTKIRSTYIRVPTKSPRVSAAVPMKYAGPSPTPDAPAPLPRGVRTPNSPIFGALPGPVSHLTWQQIQPGARGKSQLIVTHLDVHPPRSIVPGHSLGIGILKISPVTPRTTLLPYDTRPIKGSVRLILRPRCRLSLRSRGAPTPIFPPKQTSTIGRGGVLYLSPTNFNSRPRSVLTI